jgi:hypothetical protein
MKTYSAPKAAFAAIGMALLITSCGITSGSNGDDEAAKSCMQDPTESLDVGTIVNVGLIEGGTGDIPSNEELLTEVRNRAILAAEATAKDNYWQPLADAWALNEALIQSAIDGGPTVDGSGNLTAGNGSYESFLKNVNLDYASTSKDTYCRIAFSKKGMAINYEAVQK